MIGPKIVADFGSTHVPPWPKEDMVDASTNPAIVLGHSQPAPDLRKRVLETLTPMILEDAALDGRVEIAGNEHGQRVLRDALVDPSPREIGFDVAQKRVLAKVIDVEDIEAIESLPRCFQMQIRNLDIARWSRNQVPNDVPRTTDSRGAVAHGLQRG